MLNIIDNEHQSSCATTGSQIVSSNPTTISWTTAVMPGTSSSNSPGRSCPSDCANGRTGSDQWDLVLYMRSLRQVLSSDFSVCLALIDGSLRRTAHGRGQYSGATLALTIRAAQCIKRGLQSATKGRALALAVRTLRCRGAQTDQSRTISFIDFLFFCRPSRRNARLEVRAILPQSSEQNRKLPRHCDAGALGSDLLDQPKPQLRSAKLFLTEVSNTFAAS